MLHAAGHANETQHVERHESEIEADKPAPERGCAPAFIEPEAERLGEPVIVPGHQTEYDAADDDVVEVSDKKQAVVKLEIGRRYGHQHAGHAADHECNHETDRPKDRHGESEPAAEHG